MIPNHLILFEIMKIVRSFFFLEEKMESTDKILTKQRKVLKKINNQHGKEKVCLVFFAREKLEIYLEWPLVALREVMIPTQWRMRQSKN